MHDEGKEEGLIDIVPVLHAVKVASDDFGTEAEAPGYKTADAEADAGDSTGSTAVASSCAVGPTSAAAPIPQCEDWALCGCFLSWQPGLAQMWAPLGQAWPGLARVQPSGRL